MENIKFIKITSLFIAIILTCSTFGGCKENKTVSSSNENTENIENTEKQPENKENEKEYGIIQLDRWKIKEYLETTGENDNMADSVIFNLHGKEMAASFERKVDEPGMYQVYNVYDYRIVKPNDCYIFLQYNSLGFLTSYYWYTDSGKYDTVDKVLQKYNQLSQEYIEISEALTEEQCVQRAVEFLEFNSIDMRNFKLEVSEEVPEFGYRFIFQEYIDEIPTYEEAKLTVTKFGFVTEYSCKFAGNIPYYEHNPFDMTKVRRLITSTFINEVIMVDWAEFDEVNIVLSDFKFYTIPGKGIAIECDISCDWFKDSNFLTDSKLMKYCVTLE